MKNNLTIPYFSDTSNFRHINITWGGEGLNLYTKSTYENFYLSSFVATSL